MGTVRELDQKAISARLRKAREAKGLNRRQMAKAAGLTEQTCLRAEDPAGKPSPSALEPISQVLGVSIGELLYGKADEFFRGDSAKLKLFELVATLDETQAQAVLSFAEDVKRESPAAAARSKRLKS